MLLEEGDGVVRDRVRVVERCRVVFRVVLGRDEGVAAAEGGGVVVAARAGDGAVELVEAALDGPVVLGAVGLDVARHVPFADGVRAVSGRAHHLANRQAVVIQFAMVAGAVVILGHVADARHVRVEARQQRGAGGAATGAVVELGEAQALRRERVEVGRLDLPAVAADVGPAHVVREDDQDIRAWSRAGEQG